MAHMYVLLCLQVRLKITWKTGDSVSTEQFNVWCTQRVGSGQFFWTFSISCWYLLEQIRILKWGVGAIWKNHIFFTGHPTHTSSWLWIGSYESWVLCNNNVNKSIEITPKLFWHSLPHTKNSKELSGMLIPAYVQMCSSSLLGSFGTNTKYLDKA